MSGVRGCDMGSVTSVEMNFRSTKDYYFHLVSKTDRLTWIEFKINLDLWISTFSVDGQFRFR